MKRIFFLLPVAIAALAMIAACSKPSDSSQTSAAPTPSAADIRAAGLKDYTATCATCHQADGYGVSNMQPPLVDDAIVQGDPVMLIRVVLKGPAAVLPKDREPYSNTMPAFETTLTDEQIAAILTYVRHDFGHEAPPITADQVKTVRNQF